MYHDNNDCYKWYTHNKKIIQALEAELGFCVDSNEEMEISEYFTTKPMVRRSSVTPRDAAVEDNIRAAAL